MHIRPQLILLLALFLSPRRALSSDWPQFRGPNSLSHTDESNLPTRWGGRTEENVIWTSPLPKSDNPFSSPIVKKWPHLPPRHEIPLLHRRLQEMHADRAYPQASAPGAASIKVAWPAEDGPRHGAQSDSHEP